MTKDQIKELAQTYRPETALPERNVKNFLKMDEVQNLADKQLMEVMMDKGIDFTYLVDTRKQVIKESLENKQYNATLRGIEGFEELAGLRNKVKIVQKQSYTQDLGEIKQTIEKVKEQREDDILPTK